MPIVDKYPNSKTPVNVDSPLKLKPPLRSDKVYIIDGVVDLTGSGINLVIPADGLSIQGFGFNASKLICDDDDYSLFTSAIGGSGDLVIQSISISTTGTDSQVYDIVDSDGSHAIELTGVNYINCISLGSFTDYRQVLETGTGRLGSTPELTLNGDMNGYRIDTSIAFNMDNFTALFKSGVGHSFSGRFITDINCNLPAVGALADFSESTFINDETMVVQGCLVARQGAFNPNDTNIFPNIDQTSVKSNWKSNTGIKNTKKYIKATSTTEVVTTISATDTYYPLQGTVVVDRATHFEMSSNGQFTLLTGSSDYLVTGDLTISGNAQDVIDLSVTKSTDGGLTFPEQVNHISRVINNLSGPRDVAFFPINFIVELNKGDRVRIEVENKTSTNDVTMEIDSFFIISEA